MQNRIYFTAALIAITLMVSFLIPPVSAQGSNGYTGLDILFLVDQSGSMGGEEFGYSAQPTDPLGLRFEAVQYMIDTLGSYRVSTSGEFGFRVSVINFGDYAETALDWIDIAPDGTQNTWQTQRQAIMNRISVGAFGQRNLGYTNFLAAFEAARDAFDELPPLGGDEAHIRVIILLTDGAPCVPSEMDCYSIEQRLAHMRQVLDLTQEAFPYPLYRLYVVAIDDDDQYWPTFGESWVQVVGSPDRATKIETHDDVGQRFLEILVGLVNELGIEGEVGVQVDVAGGYTMVPVPPYHRLLRVTVFKSEPSGPALSVIAPDGRVVDSSTAGVTVTGIDGPIEVWSISNPMPGNWELTALMPDDRLDVFMDLIRVECRAILPTETQMISSQVPIVLELFDNEGNLLPSYPAPFSLNVTATITNPWGNEESVDLDMAGDGVYRTTYTPMIPGVYTVGLNAVTQNLDGSPLQVYQDDSVGQFEVATPTVTVSGYPQGRLAVGDTAELMVEVTDPAGNPVQMEELSARVEMIRSNTGEVVSSVDFTPRDDGLMAATVDLNEPGTWKFHVTVGLELPDGSSVTIIDERSQPFEVRYITTITMIVREPRDGSVIAATETLPPWNATDTHVRVAIIQEDGEVPPPEVLADRPLIIRARVLDATGNDVGMAYELSPTGEAAEYAVDIPGLGPGDYTLVVEVIGNLAGDYRYDEARRTINIRFSRVISGEAIATGVGIVLAILATIGGVIGFILWRRSITAHPAGGSLVILRREAFDDSYGTPIWSQELSRYNRNRIKFGKRKLPRELPIKSMLVECPTEQMSRQGRIKVTITIGQKTSNFTLGKRALKSIWHGDGSQYFLAKDVEDELFD